MDHKSNGFILRLERFLSGSDAEIMQEEIDVDQATLVTFTVEGSLFALPVERINEVVLTGTIVPIPGRSSLLEGMMKHREDIIPVVDIRRKLGFQRSSGQGAHILIAALHGTLLGLLVDAVSSVINVSREELEERGQLSRHDSGRTIRSIINQGDMAFVVLDFQALISAHEAASIQQILRSQEEEHALAG
ncbi:MAG: purine-binding chemotaxis protein CheW [Spirochaetales bacterium]|nr:purine-binding chemotaxis protein CheW [Spirochaetales bacterium]